jgi:hypothetical protein
MPGLLNGNNPKINQNIKNLNKNLINFFICRKAAADGDGMAHTSASATSNSTTDDPSVPNENMDGPEPSTSRNTMAAKKFVECSYESVPNSITLIVLKVGENQLKFPITEVDNLVNTMTKYAEWNKNKKSKQN